MRSPAPSPRRLLAILAAALLSLAPLADAAAQSVPPPVTVRSRPAPAKPDPERIGVRAMVVHATARPGTPDPRLDALRNVLAATPFQGFHLEDDRQVSLVPAQTAQVGLGAQRELSLTHVSHDAKEVRLRLRLSRGETELAHTAVSIRRGKAFVIVLDGNRDAATVLVLHVQD